MPHILRQGSWSPGGCFTTPIAADHEPPHHQDTALKIEGDSLTIRQPCGSDGVRA